MKTKTGPTKKLEVMIDKRNKEIEDLRRQLEAL